MCFVSFPALSQEQGVVVEFNQDLKPVNWAGAYINPKFTTILDNGYYLTGDDKFYFTLIPSENRSICITYLVLHPHVAGQFDDGNIIYMSKDRLLEVTRKGKLVKKFQPDFHIFSFLKYDENRIVISANNPDAPLVLVNRKDEKLWHKNKFVRHINRTYQNNILCKVENADRSVSLMEIDITGDIKWEIPLLYPVEYMIKIDKNRFLIFKHDRNVEVAKYEDKQFIPVKKLKGFSDVFGINMLENGHLMINGQYNLEKPEFPDVYFEDLTPTKQFRLPQEKNQ